MLRAICLLMTIIALPLGTASADAPTNLGANAALKYWQSFATLPTLTEVETSHLNLEWLTKPQGTQALEIVGKAEYALQMLRYGAELPHCDWGIAYQEGIYVRRPEAAAARVLSALACLRARARFEEGRDADAIDDIIAAMTLGRHISLAGTNITLLVGYSIENRAGETLALYLPRLDFATIRRLKSRLDALPSGMSLTESLGTEERFYLDWFIRQVKAAKTRDDLLALLAPVSQNSESDKAIGDSTEKAREFLEKCGGNADGLLKCAEKTRQCYSLMAKKLNLPLDQFEKEFEREAMQRSSNPVFSTFFPALVKIRQAEARVDVRRALLATALAIRLDGPDALKDFTDPVIGGRFEYVSFGTGFELRSKLKLDERPVTLVVGLRDK